MNTQESAKDAFCYEIENLPLKEAAKLINKKMFHEIKEFDRKMNQLLCYKD